ncbi:MAG TPA: DUF3500 domain-containing protein [Pirellulaceae bacterium]|nr:DUF3500 domain-containing protein [Pirellulaceae bacterium]
MSRRMLVLLLALTALCASGWKAFQAATAGQDMTVSAEKFLATLGDEERKVAQLEYDSPKRVGWHFIPLAERKGLQIKHMNESQREAAHTLLKASLSQIGYTKATKIMSLELLLKELEKAKTGTPLRDSERYYFTVFGQPSTTGKWGLSVEGHHMSLNFVVEKNRVIASTPAVFCTNPATVKNELPGVIEKGTRVLALEEDAAFELLKSLTAEQKKVAIIDTTCPKEVRAAGEAQPPQGKAVGIAGSALEREQKQLLRKLVEVYLKNHPEQVVSDRLDQIETAGWDNLHFAWAGAEQPGTGHYYRIQGPTFLVEFVNIQPDAAGNPANHIHCLWRDLRGDFAIAVESK